MRDVRLEITAPLRSFLSSSIRDAGGNEVFFLGKLHWLEEGRTRVAVLDEVDVVGRGNSRMVPAILPRSKGWDIALHNHPSGRLEPSDADVEVAALFGNEGVAFAIISNDASEHYLVTAPLPSEGPVPIDLEEVRGIFSPDGLLARSLEGFESRPGQVELAVEVARALNTDRLVASEAGTGIGKSFAYLIPSILWAVANRKRVVVSTGTINLQEQLVSKDLPFLERILPVKFRYVLVKGRGNYACRRKVEELAQSLDDPQILEAGEREQLRELVQWARTSSDGSRSDLGFVPPEGVWEKVMSETDKSLKAKCIHHDTCFFYSARRLTSSADVLVVNHHLFFADLSLRVAMQNYEFGGVLPPYERVIFDEAQHIEDIASEHLGLTLSRSGILARLHRFQSRDAKHGTAPVIVRKLSSQGDQVAAESLRRTFEGSLRDASMRVEDAFDEIESSLLEIARAGRPRSDAEGGARESFQLRQRPGKDSRFWKSVAVGLGDVRKELVLVQGLVGRGLHTLESAAVPADLKASLLLELTSFRGRLEALIIDLGRFCDYEDESMVRWIAWQEARRGGTHMDLAVAPVRVSGALKEALFERVRSAVLTSATLSVAGNTRFIEERLGLSELGDRFSFRAHPSPFDYARQVMTLVPTDFPLPHESRYEEALREAVFSLLEATGGRAFVLFTSYALLRRTYEALRPRLLALGLLPTAQGEANRSELLERFKSGAFNVLFGTDSFWEGVDVKGRALECVIITKLPFRVPTEPIQEARMEEIEARGGNSFSELSVPQAVLKLKQGFGRLIRAATDRGIVALLDRRLLVKGYGRTFLQSLPATDFTAAPTAELVERARKFLAREAPAAPAEAQAPPRFAEREPEAPETGEAPPPWSVDHSAPFRRAPVRAPRPEARSRQRVRRRPDVPTEEAREAGPPPPW